MKRIVILIGCALVMFIASCRKELSLNEFTPYASHPLNDTIWARTLPGTASVYTLRHLLAPAIILDSFSIEKDTTLLFGDSLEISFSAGSCIYPGNPAPVSGVVKLELFLLKSKGDFIKAFKPTTSHGYHMEAAAAFFVRVSKAGRDLVLSPGSTIKIRFTDTDEPKGNMQLFNGKEEHPLPSSGTDTAFNWMLDPDTTGIRIFNKINQTGPPRRCYEMIVKNLGWFIAKRYIDGTMPKSKLSVILPPNFTNKNTAVFAVFAHQKTIVQLKADYSSRSFSATNIPKTKKCKIITISRIADDMYIGAKEIDEIGNAAAFSIKPEKKSLKDIVQFLDKL